MYSDLTHDASPVDRPPTPRRSPPGTPTGHAPNNCYMGAVPEVVNITGSTGVVLGSVYHLGTPVQCPPQVDPRPPRDHVLNMLQITREVSDRERQLVSEHLGELWLALGYEMTYSRGQLQNISSDHVRLQDRAYELLSQWHDRESSDGSLAQLTRLLMRIRAFDVVNIIYSSLQPPA